MTLGLVLTLIFLALKITHNIDWSWFWIVAPVVIELGLGVLFSVIVGTFTFRWFR